MLIINAVVPMNDTFVPGMKVRLEKGCIAAIGADLAPLDGQARLHDGTLAGSVLTMKQALTNLIHRFGIAPIDAVRMCTATPAESIRETVCRHMCVGSPVPLTRWTTDWQFVSILEA